MARLGRVAVQAGVYGIKKVVGPGADNAMAVVNVHYVFVQAHAYYRDRWQIGKPLPDDAVVRSFKDDDARPQSFQAFANVSLSKRKTGDLQLIIRPEQRPYSLPKQRVLVQDYY
jgi:hypothetical protein